MYMGIGGDKMISKAMKSSMFEGKKIYVCGEFDVYKIPDMKLFSS